MTLSQRHFEVMVKAAENLRKDWGLRQNQMARILGMKSATWRRYRKHPEQALFNQDQHERFKLAIAIYKAAERLVPDQSGTLLQCHGENFFSGVKMMDAIINDGVPSMLRVLKMLERWVCRQEEGCS